MSPLVSAIVPVHDRERFVGDAVRSLLRQTLADLEVIVVDDGSTDGTVAAVEAIGDPRVRLVRHGRNRGVAEARNTGLDAARGRIVAWLDSDDVARPRRLEEQVRYLDANPSVAMVGCCAGKFGSGRGVRVPPFEHRDIAAWLLFRSAFQQSSVTGRAEILRRHPYRAGFPVCEDLDVFIRLSREHRLANLPRVLIDRRIHAGQTVRLRNDAIHAKKAELFADLLAEIGMPFGPEDLRRHVLFGKSRFAGPVGPDHLGWAEAWLMELRARNAASRRLDPDGLAFATSYFWALACLAAGRAPGMRARAAAAFARSPLSRGLGAARARAWIGRALPLLLPGLTMPGLTMPGLTMPGLTMTERTGRVPSAPAGRVPGRPSVPAPETGPGRRVRSDGSGQDQDGGTGDG